jgi:hypothetical protein
MMAEFSCPRCLLTAPLRAALRFCPRCGLAGADEVSVAEGMPLDLTADDRAYRVLERVAVGSVCSIYRCRLGLSRTAAEGVFKVARDPRANGLVQNEADVLRALHGQDPGGRFTPFLPAVDASVGVGGDGGDLPRQANVLRMHSEVRSIDELYTLADVRAAYPVGLDGRDVAWVWRRLLSVLGFVHAQGVVHAAVLPVHVLIEPRGHKLVLIDWCCSVDDAARRPRPPAILTGGYFPWFKREGGTRRPATPALDVAFAARCMIELLGGDPLAGTFPGSVEPALRRYFQRCLGESPAARAGAWRLLDEYDRLIELLWGPRTFRPLAMPPKGLAG